GVLRLLVIQPAVGIAGVHGAEAAGTGAYRPHQHDGGGTIGPALAHVRAVGLLAYGAQTMLADVALDRLEAIPSRRLDPQPPGLGLEDRGLFGRGTAFLLAVLDGGYALGGAELLTTGNMGGRVVRHRFRAPGMHSLG